MSEEERVTEMKTETIDRIAGLVENWGMVGAAGRIYGVLLLSNKPLSMEDISKESGYSASSVCQYMRLLENYGDVKRTKRPGSKKVYFEVDLDFERVLNKQFRYLLEYVTANIDMMDRSMKEYNKLKEKVEDAKLRKEIEKTLLVMEDFRDKLIGIKKFYANVLDSLEKLLKEEL